MAEPAGRNDSDALLMRPAFDRRAQALSKTEAPSRSWLIRRVIGIYNDRHDRQRLATEKAPVDKAEGMTLAALAAKRIGKRHVEVVLNQMIHHMTRKRRRNRIIPRDLGFVILRASSSPVQR